MSIHGYLRFTDINCSMSLHGYPWLDINVDIPGWISMWISLFGYQCVDPYLFGKLKTDIKNLEYPYG